MTPAWLLLLIIAFALVLLLLSWARRPAGDPNEAFRNEATNHPPTPAAGPGLKTLRTAGNTEGPAGAGPAAPAALPHSAAQASGAGEGDWFSVQVGAFTDLSQANEQVSRLRAAGFEARVVESTAATRFRYQVRSGRYATWGEAARHAGLLRAGGVAGQTVIAEPEKK